MVVHAHVNVVEDLLSEVQTVHVRRQLALDRRVDVRRWQQVLAVGRPFLFLVRASGTLGWLTLLMLLRLLLGVRGEEGLL